MGFLGRVIRFLFWFLFVAWVVWILRRLARRVTPPSGSGKKPGTPQPHPLYRDPWCGTHVSAEISVTLQQEDQVLHFCSAECRDRYLAAQRRAAGGAS